MRKSILVVEDQEDNRRILRDLLESAGFEVREALTGDSGVAMAGRQPPDLILMDIQLPVVDGHGLLSFVPLPPTSVLIYLHVRGFPGIDARSELGDDSLTTATPRVT